MAASPDALAFKQVPVNTRLANKGSVIKRYVKAPTGDPESKKQYEDYFRQYFFPALMQSQAAALGEVGELRYALFRDYIWQADSSVQRELTALAYAYATRVLGNPADYHPTVAYNAVLVLGGLDLQYGSNARNNARPSRPLPRANEELCKVVAESIEGKRPVSLQAGALVGLERHAKFFRFLPGAQRNATFRALQSVAAQNEFPEGIDNDVRAWLKRLACRGLANIGVPGPGGAIPKAIIGVVGDETLDLDKRCEVAGMLADIRFQGAAGVDFDQLYAETRKLAAQVATELRETVAEYRELQLGRGRRGDALEQLLDHRRFFVDDDQVKLRRRYFAAQLNALEKAFAAIKNVAADRAPEVDAYESAFAGAYNAVLNRDLLDLEVAEALQDTADRISDRVAVADAGGTPSN